MALIAAALVGRPGSPLWLTLGVIAFGGFNVFLDAPGTEWIRALAIGGTLAALVLPNWFFGPVALIAWLVWVPAFAVAWALAPDPPRHDPGEATRARIALATLIVAVAIGAIAYRVIVWHNLQQTAALFIGIPAVLAIVVVFGVSPDSAPGVACKAVTIGLLVSLLLVLLCNVVIRVAIETISSRHDIVQKVFYSSSCIIIRPGIGVLSILLTRVL